MGDKKRVLLNWDTTRLDLLQPFIELKEDFEFIALWRGKAPGTAIAHPFKEIYYEDFQTPYEVLRKIKPDKVLFFNINSFPQIALNLAARNKGIPTYTMHHGIYSSDSLEINKRKEEVGLENKGSLWKNNFSSLWFYFSALRPKNINQLLQYLYFPVVRKKRNRVMAMKEMPFEGRMPTKLIQLSPHNATIDKQIHHLSTDERFIYIGHPFFDKILRQLSGTFTDHSNDKFILLIDFANTENNIAFKTLTREGKHRFYKQLSSFARASGCRLKIKLHPAGFNSPHNYKDENIDLIYDADIVPLIMNAEKCFSFYSTLVIPIIYKKKFCYLFDTGMKIALQDELVELGVAKLLNAKSFDLSDLGVDSNVPEEGYRVFIERYLYFTDGKSTERLKNILIADEAA